MQPDGGHHAVFVGAREFLRQPRRDRRHGRTRLLQRHSIFQAGDSADPLCATRVGVDVARPEHERPPEFGAGRDAEPLRRHADDGHRRAVHSNRRTDDIGTSAELPAPQCVAEDHDVGCGSPLSVRIDESATELRHDAEHTEERRRDLRALHLHRLAGAGEICGRRRNRCRTGENAAVGRDVAKVRRRIRSREPSVAAVQKLNELVGPCIRQRTKQHAVHHREYGGRGADSQPHRHDGDSGEGRLTTKRAQRIANVLQNRNHGRAPVQRQKGKGKRKKGTGARQIEQLAREDRRARPNARGIGEAHLERPHHFLGVALAQSPRIEEERRAIDRRRDSEAEAHFVRDQTGRTDAWTPFRRACRTSPSSLAVSACSTAAPTSVRR